MTQTTENTAGSQEPTTQQASEATQQTTSQQTANSQPAEPTQPTSTPPPAPKSAFISDGKLPQSKPQPQQAEATSKPASEESDLKAQLTALQERLNAIEIQRTTETRTAEVERIIAPLSDTLKAVYRRTPFATFTDEEYTQLAETIKKEVSELATADKARGAVFSRPTASKPTDGKASDKETEEVLRRLNL